MCCWCDSLLAIVSLFLHNRWFPELFLMDAAQLLQCEKSSLVFNHSKSTFTAFRMKETPSLDGSKFAI